MTQPEQAKATVGHKIKIVISCLSNVIVKHRDRTNLGVQCVCATAEVNS